MESISIIWPRLVRKSSRDFAQMLPISSAFTFGSIVSTSANRSAFNLFPAIESDGVEVKVRRGVATLKKLPVRLAPIETI